MHRMRRHNRHVRLVGHRRIGPLHQLRNSSQRRNRRKLNRCTSGSSSTCHGSTSSTCRRRSTCSSTGCSRSTRCSSSTGRSFGQRRSKGLVPSGSTGSFQATFPSSPISGQIDRGHAKACPFFFTKDPLCFVATIPLASLRGFFSNWDFSGTFPNRNWSFPCPTSRLPPRSHR